MTRASTAIRWSRIAPAADRLEDPLVVLVGSGRPPGGLERLLAALDQEIHERIDDPRDGPVADRGGDRGMKGGALGQPRASRRNLRGLLFEDPFHFLNFLLRGPPGRQARDAGLDEAPRLEQLTDGLALGENDLSERLDQGLHGNPPDERPLARADLDEPQALQGPECLADGCAADLELLGEVALRREPIAGLEAPLRDQCPDLTNNLRVNARALDGLHVRPRHGPGPPGCSAPPAKGPLARCRNSEKKASRPAGLRFNRPVVRSIQLAE